MVIKRLLFAGALVGTCVLLAFPRPGGDRTVFTVSGGDLKHPISFDSNRIGPARGWWWRERSQPPSLAGPEYRLRFFESSSPSVVKEWMYVPRASGAVAILGDGLRPGVERSAWMAFTPAFNGDLIARLEDTSAPVDGRAASILLAIAAGALAVLTASGIRLYAIPTWILRLVKRDDDGVVDADPGPAYLYTSVSRSQWPWMGRLGRAPEL